MLGQLAYETTLAALRNQESELNQMRAHTGTLLASSDSTGDPQPLDPKVPPPDLGLPETEGGLGILNW